MIAVPRNMPNLQRYFDAVSATGLTREAKLDLIANTFADDAVLIRTNGGSPLVGRDGVLAFYGSPASPVMAREDFKPVPNMETLCATADGHTIAVEIELPLANGGVAKVGDFFTFNDAGFISKLVIYSLPTQLADTI
jgi:hypothetical protein